MKDETFLAEALVALANRAPIEPAGLATAIERRFVRRRFGGWTAAAVGVVVAVGLAIGVPALVGRGGVPAWRLATPGSPPPPIEQVWPDIVVDIPTEPLDGTIPSVLLVIDPTHLLVAADPRRDGKDPMPDTVPLAVYDTVRRTYREIAPIPSGRTDESAVSFVVSEHWVVWVQRFDLGERSVIYRAPRAGGPPVPIATIGYVPDALYATDTDVYWTEPGPAFGITRQPMDGGPAQPEPGAEGMVLPYPLTPWAALMTTNGPRAGQPDPARDLYVTRVLHNIVTGQDIQIRVPPGTTSLQCTPQLCVGNAATSQETGAFIQRPDGSDRAPLLFGGGDSIMAYPAAGRTLLIFGGSGPELQYTVDDPTSGRIASLRADQARSASIEFDVVTGILTRYSLAAPVSPLYYLGGVR